MKRVGAMNEAKNEEKTEAMAAVVHELVPQHKEMHDGMIAMHSKMRKMMDKMGLAQIRLKGLAGKGSLRTLRITDFSESLMTVSFLR